MQPFAGRHDRNRQCERRQRRNQLRLRHGLPSGASLLDSVTALQGYDMVLMNCAAAPAYFAQGGAYVTAARQQNMKTYLDGGGKVFLEHYFSTFLRSPGTPEPAGPYGDIATWEYPPAGSRPFRAADMLTYIDQTFDKGKAFAQWLKSGASPTHSALLQLTNSAVTSVPAVEIHGVRRDGTRGALDLQPKLNHRQLRRSTSLLRLRHAGRPNQQVRSGGLHRHSRVFCGHNG
jgi:hypothetical protein